MSQTITSLDPNCVIVFNKTSSANEKSLNVEFKRLNIHSIIEPGHDLQTSYAFIRIHQDNAKPLFSFCRIWTSLNPSYHIMILNCPMICIN